MQFLALGVLQPLSDIPSSVTRLSKESHFVRQVVQLKMHFPKCKYLSFTCFTHSTKLSKICKTIEAAGA